MQRLELIVGALGSLLVVAVVIFLIWQGWFAQARPADLTVGIVDITEAGSGYRVRLSVHNSGGHAAAGAVVEGSLVQDGTTVETSQVTIDYVPAGTAEEAALVFSRDPGPLDLQLRPVSYHDP